MDPTLAKIDQYVDDDELFQMIKADLAKRWAKTLETGRNSTPVEVVLRMLVVKRLYRYRYEETERYVRDSLVLRQFCRVYLRILMNAPEYAGGELPITILEAAQVGSSAYDVVVEATGSPQGFQQARRVIRPRRVLVMKSTYHGEMLVDFSSLVVDEITLVGSLCGSFEPALRLMAGGLVVRAR